MDKEKGYTEESQLIRRGGWRRETETVLDPFPPHFTNLKNTALVIEI